MQAKDRQESIKSAGISAAVAFLVATAIAAINHWIAGHTANHSGPIQLVADVSTSLSVLTHLDAWAGFLNIAVAIISATLFGIAYRYIASQQDNPHLRSGAVGAFGFVRGLAIAESGLAEGEEWLVLAVLGIESLLFFGVVAAALDLCFRNQWVRLSGAMPTIQL